jgi:hypothetical protein
MPNRILKESVCTSATIDSLSPEEELFFYRLLVQCDDFGRMDARPAILRARCYPLRLAAVTDGTVARWLSGLQKTGLVSVYCVDGQPYLQVSTWDKHQQVRAKRSKYPAPCKQALAGASNCNQMQADDSICSRNPYPNPYPNPKEHMVDATASTGSDPAPPEPPKPKQPEDYSTDFICFWNGYPRKKNKRGAYRCWRARLKERLESGDAITPAMLITAGRLYAARCAAQRTAVEYIKHPATFLSRDHVFAEYLVPQKPQTRAEETAAHKAEDAKLRKWMAEQGISENGVEVKPAG